MAVNIIGRSEIIALPEFEIGQIEAKIDTGAYGNALHCHRIHVVHKYGKEILSFTILDPSHPEYDARTMSTEHFNKKRVKSSIGVSELRYTITTTIIMFNKSYPLEFSLTDRGKMRFPVLLGRKFLKSRFIVDVRYKNLSSECSKANQK
ncbi:MAG TPA: hypothetical protein DDX92_00540 [Flavobacteriales bacterium]|jgi:hypothetical protein|nr:hypothetical protein [Flavobacteriales bacterium]